MRLNVIDLETTGLDPAEGAEIIEFGVVTLDDGGPDPLTPSRADDGADLLRLVDRRQGLVKPSRTVPPETSAIHHIVDADLVDAMPQAAAMEIIGQRDGIFVAHNARFEQGFLDPEGLKPWICTFKVSKRLWPDLKSHSNQGLRYIGGIIDIPEWGVTREELMGVHRALPDALVTAALVCRFRKHVSPLEMIQISREPTWMPTIPFGKHKGAAWADVDRGYLEWMLKQAGMDEDAKHWARVEIERR